MPLAQQAAPAQSGGKPPHSKTRLDLAERKFRKRFVAFAIPAATCPGQPALRTSMKASCGMFTVPMDFMRALPSFCFSRSLRLRVMSPP